MSVQPVPPLGHSQPSAAWAAACGPAPRQCAAHRPFDNRGLRLDDPACGEGDACRLRTASARRGRDVLMEPPFDGRSKHRRQAGLSLCRGGALLLGASVEIVEDVISCYVFGRSLAEVLPPILAIAAIVGLRACRHCSGRHDLKLLREGGECFHACAYL